MSLLKETIRVITLGFLLSIGVYYVFAQGTWTEPTAPPPGNNILAPLNSGPDGQEKAGGLLLNTGGAPIGLAVNGIIDALNHRVTGVATPTDNSDAVNKAYVDAQAGGGGGGGFVQNCTIRSSGSASAPVVAVSCVADEKVVSGGCSSQGGLIEDRPTDQGWMCGSVTASTKTAYANCCTVVPGGGDSTFNVKSNFTNAQTLTCDSGTSVINAYQSRSGNCVDTGWQVRPECFGLNECSPDYGGAGGPYCVWSIVKLVIVCAP